MKRIMLVMLVMLMAMALTGCDLDASVAGSRDDVEKTLDVGNSIHSRQPTPTDISYSLERYNLIRRAYWVNGQREKANALVCEVVKPLGYAVLLSDNGAVVGSFAVDGKLSSLNSFLTPDSEYYEKFSAYHNKWLPDVDGTYGDNDNGIFFFTPQGQYIEWNGTYLYSDIPFHVADPVLKHQAEGMQ